MNKILEMKKFKIPLIIVVCIALVACVVIFIGQRSQKSNYVEEAQGITNTESSEVSVRISKFQSESFTGMITDTHGSETFTAGGEIHVMFDEDTTIIQKDGSKFGYNAEEPNAQDCDLPQDTVVTVTFNSYEYDSEGKPTRIYANSIEPAE